MSQNGSIIMMIMLGDDNDKDDNDKDIDKDNDGKEEIIEYKRQ